RNADVPRGITDHEREELGRGFLRREDQIALVLPILVVHHDHRTARGDIRDRTLDAPDIHGGPGAACRHLSHEPSSVPALIPLCSAMGRRCGEASFSTYLAS